MLLSLAVFFAAAMGFTYLGYPALAFLLSRLAARPVKKGPFFPTLSVILPVHNEAASLPGKIDNILSQDYPADRLEIIVIDDGSTDGAVDRLQGECECAVRLIKCPSRRGKASALNVGAEGARGDVLVFADARQQLAPGSLRALASNFADPRVTVVTGRLEAAGGGAEGLFRRYEEALRRWESAWGNPAGVTGALYAARRECVSALPAETILDDLVLSLCAASKGRLAYEPGAVAREGAESAEKRWNRRLRTLAGNWQIVFHPLKFRGIFSKHTALQLACHKFLRLLFPLFALGFFVCAGALLGPLGALVLAAAGALALVSAVSGRPAGFARGWRVLSSPLVAPLGALVRYVRGRESVLWARE